MFNYMLLGVLSVSMVIAISISILDLKVENITGKILGILIVIPVIIVSIEFLVINTESSEEFIILIGIILIYFLAIFIIGKSVNIHKLFYIEVIVYMLIGISFIFFMNLYLNEAISYNILVPACGAYVAVYTNGGLTKKKSVFIRLIVTCILITTLTNISTNLLNDKNNGTSRAERKVVNDLAEKMSVEIGDITVIRSTSGKLEKEKKYILRVEGGSTNYFVEADYINESTIFYKVLGEIEE